MKKFTFITLVMILGMSSVSFGKDYLCLSSHGILITNNQYRKLPLEKGSGYSLNKLRFMVKTEGNNSLEKILNGFLNG